MVKMVTGSVKTHRSVAGGAKRLGHALLRASQNITTCSHCATNQNRLPGQLIGKEKLRLEKTHTKCFIIMGCGDHGYVFERYGTNTGRAPGSQRR